MVTVTLNLNMCTELVRNLVSEQRLPQELLEVESHTKKTSKSFLERLCEGIVRSRDAENFKSEKEWAENLVFSSVLLTRNEYLEATVHALRLAPKIAATDYGTSRQRDLAQIWTDAIRGFLGEIAFRKWLRERFGIEVKLDFRRGPLEEFLPSDLTRIKKPREEWRKPKLRVSIKTTKLQGMWLDVPYAQLEHSDVFVLVRVGVSRGHFLAFLKDISVIMDKILTLAQNQGLEVSREEFQDSIPEFKNIPAFVVGFFDKNEVADKLQDRRTVLTVDGDLKKKRSGGYRLILNRFAGWWNPKDPECKKRVVDNFMKTHPRVRLDADKLNIEFEGLGEISETLHFLVSSGALKQRREDWEKLINRL
ncbi:MAG: hypothetical protein QW290_08980 [Sulfolobales archaeon]